MASSGFCLPATRPTPSTSGTLAARSASRIITPGWATAIYNGIGGGPTRPLQIADPHKGGHQINQWFNPQAFIQPQPGQFGNTSRNSLNGPTFQHVDLSLFKNLLITERFNLELRAEAFNLTNTVGYFVPNNQNDFPTTNATGTYIAPGANGVYDSTKVVPGGGFAQILTTNPSYTPRKLQFAVKLKF